MRNLMFLCAASVCAITYAAETGSGSGGGKAADKAASKPEPDPKSPVAQANAGQIDGAEPALIETDAEVAPGTEGAVIAELRAKLAEAEHAVAAERGMRMSAEDQAESLRAHMVSGGGVRKVRPDGKVEVRVKTPLEIYPDEKTWDYVANGPPPPSAKLTPGLNYVEPWVADHWLVKGSLEDDFATDQAEAAAEEPATES